MDATAQSIAQQFQKREMGQKYVCSSAKTYSCTENINETLKNCSLVMTDSGGLQKEAYFFGKTCITMRDETEWVELVENGFNTIVGADREKILAAVLAAESTTSDFSMNLYGDGNAGKKIMNALVAFEG
jgi:UDP-N-acetylglucosamine 2-epimerase